MAKAASKKSASKEAPKKQSAPQKSQAPAGVAQPASTTASKTRSQLVKEGKSKNASVVQPKGFKVSEPVSTPENTNNGAAPYGAPKEDYGGNQTGKGKYIGDVLSTPSDNLE